jgi:CubicO group peptidase (beta-lactamase class C family)
MIPTKTATTIPSPPPTQGPTNTPAPVRLNGVDPKTFPISGVLVPELLAYDQAMYDFMRARNIPAGALAVTRNGKLLLAHGYGYADRERTRSVQPDTPFRYMSITKPVTAAAVKSLIRQGKLQLTTRVLPLLELAAGDPRMNDITIQHLLEHKGGWDIQQLGYDPMFRAIEIKQALGLEGLPNEWDIARYMVGQPLSFAPGTREAYSNFGYLLLGLAIEKVSGKSYIEYVQQNIFQPLGIRDIELARTLPQDRNPREPFYSDPYQGRNVFAPPDYPLVSWADGGWVAENMDAHGGLIGSASSYAAFMDKYWVNGDPRRGENQDWVFFGSLDGTFTMARWKFGNINIVALFNQRADASGLKYDDIWHVMDEVTNSIKQQSRE